MAQEGGGKLSQLGKLTASHLELHAGFLPLLPLWVLPAQGQTLL